MSADTPLAERHCVPCDGGTPPVPEAVARELLAEIPGWALESGRLVRRVQLPDFMSAVKLVDGIAEIAEEQGHHPDLELGWGRLTVRLWTHAIGALSDNDFVLAARLERLLRDRA